MNKNCKWCGGQPHPLSAHSPRPWNECPGCWELRVRIEADPLIAYRMLDLDKVAKALKVSTRSLASDPGGWLDTLLKGPPKGSQTPLEDK